MTSGSKVDLPDLPDHIDAAVLKVAGRVLTTRFGLTLRHGKHRLLRGREVRFTIRSFAKLATPSGNRSIGGVKKINRQGRQGSPRKYELCWNRR